MKKMLFILVALLVATPVMAAPGVITFGSPVTTVAGQVTIPWTSTTGVVGISLKVNVDTGGTASSVTVNPTSFFDVFVDHAFSTPGYTYPSGTNSMASQTAAGELTGAQQIFSICVGGLDDSPSKTDLIDQPPVGGNIVIVGTAGKAVTLDADALRGGIVDYNGVMTVVTLPIVTQFGAAVVETITPAVVTKPTNDGFVNGGRVETFVATGGVSSVSHPTQYQFNWGDGSGLTWGTATQTHTYAYTTSGTYSVTVQARCIADPAIITAVSGAKVVTKEAVKSTAGTIYTDWVAFGRPSCWAFQRNCRGDADGLQVIATKTTPAHWVGTPDLGILSAGWKRPNTDPGFASFICADFDHAEVIATKTTPAHRVGTPDLGLLSASWKNDTVATVCPSANYWFWTN